MGEILFVVHRYVPFPGGSEYYVRDMAEEMHKRGHKVTVLAHTHQGNQGPITVTNDYNILVNNHWSLIIVHGCDCVSQNIVLSNAALIKSPILYMIIKPSNSSIALHGMKYAKYLAYSTTMDLNHIKFYGFGDKARRVRHGIVPESSKGHIDLGHKQTHISEYVSAGGFSTHKAMVPLARAFEDNLPHPDAHLSLYGYMDGDVPTENANVSVYRDKTKQDVMDAIANSDGYILNSYEEGFGLVLLEAMFNMVPVYARNIAGAKDMAKYIYTYESEEQLMNLLKQHQDLTREHITLIENAFEYVCTNHMIEHTVNDIEDILWSVS